jgi:decaprenylphospho-beta-D-ribofuranose 2-oxidase
LDRQEWLDEAAGVLRVAGGTSLDALMRRVVPKGWFVPVTPGTRHVTIGGAVAADIHGKNHHRDGTFARHVTRLVLATPAGVTTVTPADDADLFWATAGGLGLTGVILEADVRLIPVATSAIRVVTQRAGDLDEVMALMEQRDRLHRYSVAWVDGVAGGGSLGRGVITWGDHAALDDLPPASRHRPLAFDAHTPAAKFSIPPVVPPNVLTPFTVGVFNGVWFRRAPRTATTTVEPLTRFFHPLDAVGGWNRLYGRRGLVQYQFVVPLGAGGVVRTALERLRALGSPSFLAVLKRFGAADPGPLSFPAPGWTLALDVPNGTPRLSETLDGLDELVAEAGGRVYLAKDARLRPDLLAAMYPRLSEWFEVKRRIDPDGRFTSDLARRLGLAPARARA